MTERKMWGIILMVIGASALLCLGLTIVTGIPAFVSLAFFLAPSITFLVFGIVFLTVWRSARQQKATSHLAIGSFALGILGFVALGSVLPTMMTVFVLGVPGGLALAALGIVPAVACGHLAGFRIRASHGQIEGRALARTGLVFGYVNIAIAWVVLTSPFQARALYKHYSVPCKNNMDRMEKTYRQHAQQIENRFEEATPAPDSKRPDKLPLERFPELVKGKAPVCPLGGEYTVMRGGLLICSEHGDTVTLSHD